jgi:hypothetical protein
MVGSLSARAIRARIHANTLFAALLFTLSNLACQDAPDLLRDADPPVAADPGDDTQFLTLDDEIEPAAAPPAASELRILAQKSPDAEGMGWEFLVTGADDNPVGRRSALRLGFWYSQPGAARRRRSGCCISQSG